MYNCLHSINSLYVEKTELGYNATPCCLYKEKNTTHVHNIQDLLDNPKMNEIREGFKGDWKRPECMDCVMKEELGIISKRQTLS